MERASEPAQNLRLQDLIEKRKKELRLGWDDLVERSRSSGYTISTNRWHHWAQTEWTKTPNPEVVRSMAAALELSTDVVYEAAGISVNLYTQVVPIDSKMRVMVAAFNDITSADQDLVIDMIRAVANNRRATQDADDAERKL